MTDLSMTIAPKSDQLNADDLISGPRTIRVTRVSGNESNADQPINIYFEGDNGKPFRPCKSMRRVMVSVWGADGGSYAGRSMTLYRDPKVKFGGIEVGGIRISHMTGIEKPVAMALTASRAKREQYTVLPLEDTGDADAEAVEKAQNEARAVAAKGADAFTEWWNSDAKKPLRGFVRPILAELKALSEAAKAPSKPESDDDPLGGEGAPEPDPAAELAQSITVKLKAALVPADVDQIVSDWSAQIEQIRDRMPDEAAKLDALIEERRKELS